jgi:hypothetical protein
MAPGALSIKLRCASWQQLATIYQRDLSRGTMFLKATNPPALGTSVRIDLTLPSSSVIVLTGVVHQHINDPARGNGVELKLAPIPTGSIWLIESALASEARQAPSDGKPQTPMTPPAKSGPIAQVGGEMAEAEAELIGALKAEAESMKRLNPFLVLGVSYNAGDQDIRNAFGELTKKYHPDRFARYESSDLRAVAAEIFILIRDAYRKLGDATGRAAALAAIGKAVTSPSMPPVRPTPQPHRISQPIRVPTPPSGVQKLAPEGRIPTPMSGVQKLPPTKPGVHDAGTVRKPPEPALLEEKPTPKPQPVGIHDAGTVRKPEVASGGAGTMPTDAAAVEELVEAGKLEEALAAYRVLAKKHPADRVLRAGIELCEGLRSLAQRDRLEAAQRFEAALEIDPSNERAARELADMRRHATNERKGLLSKLMGKKE